MKEEIFGILTSSSSSEQHLVGFSCTRLKVSHLRKPIFQPLIDVMMIMMRMMIMLRM